MKLIIEKVAKLAIITKEKLYHYKSKWKTKVVENLFY